MTTTITSHDMTIIDWQSLIKLIQMHIFNKQPYYCYFIKISKQFTPNSNNEAILKNTKSLNSFMTEVSVIQKPVHWFTEQINGLVSM